MPINMAARNINLKGVRMIPNSPIPGPQGGTIMPFFALTGVTFFAFASGFGVCLFDLSQVNACVDHAVVWVDKFRAMGDQIIQWGIAVLHNVLQRYPLK